MAQSSEIKDKMNGVENKRHWMSRVGGFIYFLIATSVLMSCASSELGIVGTWTRTSPPPMLNPYGGVPDPYITYTQTFVFESNGTFNETTTANGSSEPGSGTWAGSGVNYTIFFTGGSTFSAAESGSTLTIDGFTFVNN